MENVKTLVCVMSRDSPWNSTLGPVLRYLHGPMLARTKLSLLVALAVSAGCEGSVAIHISRDGGLPRDSAVLMPDADAGATVPTAQCPAGSEPRVVQVDTPVKLDLLFMIDDSPSMQEEQANLARNFPRLIDELKKLPTGFPDLHLGVVSSDLGAGTSAACGSTVGDRAVLQVRPGCGLDPKNGRYLVSENGGTSNNFDGDLSDVFACLAELGTQGCGFEHQLQAVRLALSGLVTENSGFLRSEAHLAIVYITDEYDCSAPADTTMFSGDIAGQDSSLRCSLWGHVCDGAPVPAAAFSAPLAQCGASPNGGGKLIPVQTFIDDMKQLRTQSVSVSVIGGWPADADTATYAIGYDTTSPYPDILTELPICQSANGKAVVELRMKQFVDALGPTGKILSICQDDFSNAMEQIGQLINTTVECQ